MVGGTMASPQQIQKAFNQIQHLHPDIEAQCLIDCAANMFLTTTDVVRYIRTTWVGNKRTSSDRIEWWVVRGWTKEEAVEKFLSKRETPVSPFSQTFWKNRINKKTNLLFTNEEIEIEIKSQRPNSHLYWMKKGNDLTESKKLATEHQQKSGIIANIKMKSDPKKYSKSNSTRIEYWLNKGLSNADAAAKLSDRQATFSLDKCIKKYGETDGLTLWQERQKLWQKTLLENGTGGTDSSLIANSLFAVLTQKFPLAKCAKNGGEKRVYFDDKQYCLDLFFNDRVIEFFGDYWHANPKIYEGTGLISMPGKGKIPVKEIWEKDNKKINDLKTLGLSVMIVWEQDYKNDPQLVIDKCLGFLSAAK